MSITNTAHLNITLRTCTCMYTRTLYNVHEDVNTMYNATILGGATIVIHAHVHVHVCV